MLLISVVIKDDRAIFVWPWNENPRTKQKQQTKGNKAIWLVYRTDANAPGLWLVKRTLGWKNFMPEELSRNRFDVILQHDWSIEQCFLHIRVFTHVVFSLMWPASMLIEKKENFYIKKKEYNSQSIFLVHQQGRRSIVLEKTNMAPVTSCENALKRLYLSYRVHAFNPVIHVYVWIKTRMYDYGEKNK